VKRSKGGTTQTKDSDAIPHDQRANGLGTRRPPKKNHLLLFLKGARREVWPSSLRGEGKVIGSETLLCQTLRRKGKNYISLHNH